MKRTQFVNALWGTGLLLGTVPMLSLRAQEEEQLDKKMVQEFVGASHTNMDKVMEMLEEHPTLLNAAHDWKRGDFETGLGAASHVGYKELATYFLEKGAQANIFTACLFGKLDIVKPMLTAFPATLHARGPHGLTLLHHAVKGGDEALAVRDYIQSLGASEMKIALF